jgi:hypothetical protein
MNRPKLILLVNASIDGRITFAPNMTLYDTTGSEDVDNMMGDLEDWNSFSKEVKQFHNPDVWVEGSNMLVKDNSELRNLPEFTGDPDKLYQDYLPESVINRKEHEGWLAVVDGKGRLRSGFKSMLLS